MRFQGKKDGYFFTTGIRGTGYYLDPTYWDFNDPDDDGYVLVRTSPAVAIKRATRKREVQGLQGLLLSPSLLEALGPAHGAPPHRYKLAAPPWLCGMPPPRERLDKRTANNQGTVTVSNELLTERLASVAAKLEGTVGSRYDAPTSARVKAKRGAIVRKAAALSSEAVGELAPGTSVVAVEEATDETTGTRRARLVEPVRGWVSLRMLDFDVGATSDVVAAVEAMCVVDARGGPLTLRGEDLEPVPPPGGPWTFELLLCGPDARNAPLAIQAKLKRNALVSWPAAKLIDVFAARHDAKYGGKLAEAHLRLHLAEDDVDYIDPQTRLAEVVRDWTAPVCAALVVKRKLGADAAKPLVFPRAAELARREQDRAPDITDWSSQADVLRARAIQGYEAPATSAEIQQYWADRKHQKHWRTIAALKGFTTRTDDQAKLEKWTGTLQPQRGFFLDDRRPPLYQSSDDPPVHPG